MLWRRRAARSHAAAKEHYIQASKASMIEALHNRRSRLSLNLEPRQLKPASSCLLGAPESVADLSARKHSRIHHLELIRADAADGALLINTDLIGEGAGLDLDRDDLA